MNFLETHSAKLDAFQENDQTLISDQIKNLLTAFPPENIILVLQKLNSHLSDQANLGSMLLFLNSVH